MIETAYIIGIVITTLVLYIYFLKKDRESYSYAEDTFLNFLLFLLSFMLSFVWPILLVLLILFLLVHLISKLFID